MAIKRYVWLEKTDYTAKLVYSTSEASVARDTEPSQEQRIVLGNKYMRVESRFEALH